MTCVIPRHCKGRLMTRLSFPSLWGDMINFTQATDGERGPGSGHGQEHPGGTVAKVRDDAFVLRINQPKMHKDQAVVVVERNQPTRFRHAYRTSWEREVTLQNRVDGRRLPHAQPGGSSRAPWRSQKIEEPSRPALVLAAQFRQVAFCYGCQVKRTASAFSLPR